MDVASNSGCVISIFDDHLQFNNTVIKGYLYHELLLILQSGKIPTELIDVLPTNLKVTDHRYQQTYNICLAPSLKANFDLMESTASSNFDMLMRESEQLKSVKIDLSDFNFNKRAHDHFIEHKYNAVIKKQRIEEIEDIIEDNAQVDDDFNLELMYKPADVSFLSKLNQVRHVLKERQSIPIETIEENKVKSIVGFVIVQSLKFKHKWQNRYLTVNLLSSQSEDYFQAVLYFGSQPDTILDGFQTRIAIGPRNAISISFDQLINSYKAVYDVVFDSKLNIASPPQSRQAVATPDLDEIQSDTVTQQQQYTNHQQLPPKQRVFFIINVVIHTTASANAKWPISPFEPTAASISKCHVFSKLQTNAVSAATNATTISTKYTSQSTCKWPNVSTNQQSANAF